MPPLVRQLLLVPLLAPLLAILLIGAFNPRPAVALRLLTWTTPSLPVGVWMMLAATGGAGLSALGTALALGGEPRLLQRQVRRRWDQRPGAAAADPGDAWIADPPEPRRPPQPGIDWDQPATPASAGPTRAAGESSPTVAVPYRVIRRGETTASAAARPSASSTSTPPASSAPAGTTWPAADDWNQPLSEAW